MGDGWVMGDGQPKSEKITYFKNFYHPFNNICTIRKYTTTDTSWLSPGTPEVGRAPESRCYVFFTFFFTFSFFFYFFFFFFFFLFLFFFSVSSSFSFFSFSFRYSFIFFFFIFFFFKGSKNLQNSNYAIFLLRQNKK